jgi:hypothetical protein
MVRGRGCQMVEGLANLQSTIWSLQCPMVGGQNWGVAGRRLEISVPRILFVRPQAYRPPAAEVHYHAD